MGEAEAVNGSAFDAEAVLLALGPQLEWRSLRGNEEADTPHLEMAFVEQGAYSVGGFRKRRWLLRFFRGKYSPLRIEASFTRYPPSQQYISHANMPCENYKRALKSIDEAKAACEWHHAKGKWE